MILDADGRFTLSVSSTDTQAIESLDRSIYSITLMDGPPDACAFGLCDMYTDVVTAPAVPVPAMGIPGLVIFIALLAGAAICVLAKRNFVQSY